MQIKYRDIFREIEAISKVLRCSIRHMPKYYRYNVGDRIINLLIDLKLKVKLSVDGISYSVSLQEIYNDLIKLSVLMDDAVEDGCLLLKGKYTIFEPYQRLIALTELLQNNIRLQDGYNT